MTVAQTFDDPSSVIPIAYQFQVQFQTILFTVNGTVCSIIFRTMNSSKEISRFTCRRILESQQTKPTAADATRRA